MSSRPSPTAVRDLESGDHMTREEFHRAYVQAPEDFKAELIRGIVYVASPLKRLHGVYHGSLTTVLGLYESRTPGVECGDNATLLLGEDSEPQPDLYLRILPQYGGQSRTSEDDYIAGAPELVAEIAHSSHSIDFHAKRLEYARYGVQEYLVLSLRDQQLRWFDLRQDQQLRPDPDGILRLHTFPGLWLHANALLARDYPRMIATLDQGLATADHEAFVRHLAAAGETESGG